MTDPKNHVLYVPFICLLCLFVGITSLAAEAATILQERDVAKDLIVKNHQENSADTEKLDDGKIVESKVVQFPGRFLKRLKIVWPESEEMMPKLEMSSITYMSDGLKVKGIMVRPKEITKPLPCVIYNRGGNQNFGALKAGQAAVFLGPIAARGYVVVASQYRGNAGGEGKEEFGGKDLNDVMNLIPLLEKQKGADTNRIGMVGWSRGGMMTYLALRKTNKIKAAVIGAGVTDQFAMAKSRPKMESEVMAKLIPNFKSDRENQLKARSAKFWPEKLCKTTPILIMHGSADWRVPPSQAFEMLPLLHKVNQPFRFVMFEGGDHGIREHRSEVDRMTMDWLDKYVRDGRKWPDLEPHGR